MNFKKSLEKIRKRFKKSKKYDSDLYHDHVGVLLNVIDMLEAENNRLFKKLENIENESESHFLNLDYKTLKDKDFIFKSCSRGYGKTTAQMEQFLEYLKQIEKNKIYGICKNENSDIYFILEEMIPKKEIEKLLY